MSYSYVKTVFPDFKYSNVYDTKLYENLNVSQHDSKLIEPVDLDINTSYSSISILEKSNKEESKIETFQDNQKVFNSPLPSNNIPLDNNIIKKENFYSETKRETETKSEGHHLEYTKHVLECGHCKELLMKQFGLENERIRNEEIMELISYLIFGLFILLLIDTYVKK
jgi:hypothetical protein